MALVLRFRCPCCGASRGVQHYGLDPLENGEVYLGRPEHTVERLLFEIGGRGSAHVVERGAINLEAARALAASVRDALAQLESEIAEAVNAAGD